MTKIYNFKFKILNFQKGFTLIEAVVATALFAFVVSSTLGVYLSTIQLDRKTRAQRAVAQNARFILEYLVKEVRNGQIDYSRANNCVNSSTVVCVINQAAEAEKISYDGSANLVLTKNGSSTNLNSAAGKVASCKFYLQPAGDPFTAAKTYSEQPRVTMTMGLISNYGSGPTDHATLNLETTFSPRYYPTR